MHVKNGIKDLKRYPQISRRVRDTLAPFHCCRCFHRKAKINKCSGVSRSERSDAAAPVSEEVNEHVSPDAAGIGEDFDPCQVPPWFALLRYCRPQTLSGVPGGVQGMGKLHRIATMGADGPHERCGFSVVSQRPSLTHHVEAGGR